MQAKLLDELTKPDGAGPLLDVPGRLEPGTVVGHFRLQRCLGQGGMGEVWLAEQFEPFERWVAIKMIKQRFDHPWAEAMFLIERQALARLDHPHIARVYEAGSTSRGDMYLAMEYVEGLTLDRFLAQARGEAQLLLLFHSICRAVQHAHSRNIVHRDLKPQNILITEIDGHPQPKIIDFGIAAAPGMSGSGGTHAYMSPEQAEGFSDQRTDVYSLGVILLELIAHARHITIEAWRASTASQRMAMLAPDAELGKRLSFDERELLASALALDIEQRVSTVQALGEDVHRLAQKLPLNVVPHTARYVVARFVQRNRGKVAIAALLLLVMIGMLLVATEGWRRAYVEAHNAELAARFYASLLEGVSPQRAAGMDKTLMLRVLDEAGERAERELADAPGVLAALSATLAATYGKLGADKTALQIAETAHANARRTLGQDHPLSLRLAYERASSLQRLGRLKDSPELIATTYEAQVQRLGASASATLASAAVWVSELRMAGQVAEANALAQRALVPRRPDNVEGWQALATEAAHAAASNGDHERSIGLLGEVVASVKERVGEQGFELSFVRNELAVAYFVARRYQEARDTFAAVLPEFERVLGAGSSQTLTARGNLAAAYTLTGAPEKALVLTAEVLERRRAMHGPEHPETLNALGNHAATAMRAGELALAEVLFAETVELCDRVRSPTHPTCAERKAGYGKVLRDLGQFAQAERVLLDAWERKGQVEGKQFASQAQVALELAELYRRWQRPEREAEWRQRAEPSATR